MAAEIWEFFGYSTDDNSESALEAAETETCPIIGTKCEKTFNDGVVSGVCTIKPITSEPVICCPTRLYADDYQILKDVSLKAFEQELPLVPGREAVAYARENSQSCIAVFGRGWGGELRLPQKSGSGGYFVDWVLGKLGEDGSLQEFTAVEVQTIDTTGNYRNGFAALRAGRTVEKTTAGLNWETSPSEYCPSLSTKARSYSAKNYAKKACSLFALSRCSNALPKGLVERIV
jgi:hypothetical protein